MGKHHGLRNTRLYSIWRSMRTRCYNPKAINYQWYGAKGIKVCDEWQCFLPFYDWAVRNGYSDNLTLDRIESDGNYTPENCRWITISEQQQNRSDNALITINGETKCLSEWSRIYGINYGTARSRHENGVPWEQAFSQEVRHS